MSRGMIIVIISALVLVLVLVRGIKPLLKKLEGKTMSRGMILVTSVLILVFVCGISIPLSWVIGRPLAAITSAAVAMVVWAALIYFWWAPNNLFWTFVPEGRAKIIIKGDAFAKVLVQWENHALAEIPDPGAGVDAGDVVEVPTTRRAWLGGLQFYGFWPISDVFIYDFGWANVTQSGQVVQHPKETLDYVLLKTDVYWAVVKAAEDKELMPLNIELVLTMRVVNPYKALFLVQNWLETVINRIEPAVRDTLTTDTYANWIKEPKDLGQVVFARLEERNLLKEFRGTYGVELISMGVKDIDPGDDWRAATMRKTLAERNREGIIVEADAEGQRIERVFGAVQKFNDLGRLIRVLEALEKAPGQGSKMIIPLPGMADFLSQVFPGRTVGSLTPEEIKALKGLAAQVQAQQGASVQRP